MAGEAAAATGAGRFFLAVALMLAACTVPLAAAQVKSEAEVLSEFRAALRGPDGGPPRELNQWATGGAPCVVNATLWPRVKKCINGRVVVLQLEALQLQGAAPDLALLAPLQGLRSLNLGKNNLTGAFPDVSALPALRSFFLFQNRLAGEIPDGAFAALRGLQRLGLSGNAFSGPIPSSVASSSKLVSVDLSNNNFSGPVPEGLRKLGANVKLEGNKFLCGDMVGTPCPSPSPPSGNFKFLTRCPAKRPSMKRILRKSLDELEPQKIVTLAPLAREAAAPHGSKLMRTSCLWMHLLILQPLCKV